MNKLTNKLLKLRLLGLVLCGLVLGGCSQEPHTQISQNNFFSMIYSQATYLEQCISRRIIPSTDVHNWNQEKAAASGAAIDVYWDALRNGADGRVYDLLRGQWIRVPFDKINCEMVLIEQNKIKESLSRY